MTGVRAGRPAEEPADHVTSALNQLVLRYLQQERAPPIGDRSSQRKWSYFPALAASRRAARATAPQMASPTETGSRPLCGASMPPFGSATATDIPIR